MKVNRLNDFKWLGGKVTMEGSQGLKGYGVFVIHIGEDLMSTRRLFCVGGGFSSGHAHVQNPSHNGLRFS